MSTDTDSSATDNYLLQEQTQTTPVEIENTTNQLPLTGDIRGSYAETGADLGAALASSSIQMQVDYERYALFEREFDQATPEERATIIEDTHSRLKERIDALEPREQEMVKRYAAGEMTKTVFLQQLSRNHHEAVALQNALDELENHLVRYSVPGEPLSRQQLRADRSILDAYTTPIRTEIDAINKMQSPNERYEYRIQASQDGYRLSAIDGDSYVTETIRFDNRDIDGVNQYQALNGTNGVITDVSSLYPWPNVPGAADYHDRSRENLYVMDAAHDGVSIDVYFDGATGAVYREIQSVPINYLPAVEVETKSYPNLKVVINKTPANGPIELTAIDTETGDPAQETILVNGVEIGTTDESGTLQYLPPTEQHSITINRTTRQISSE
uniref:DUF7096 domain-containing protein n=1 Tax=Natrialba asiatica TaxID=64602 RepID=UPI001F4CA453|nr:hypothetical protein [Natrialba asiatica]